MWKALLGDTTKVRPRATISSILTDGVALVLVMKMQRISAAAKGDQGNEGDDGDADAGDEQKSWVTPLEKYPQPGELEKGYLVLGNDPGRNDILAVNAKPLKVGPTPCQPMLDVSDHPAPRDLEGALDTTSKPSPRAVARVAVQPHRRPSTSLTQR